MAKGIFDKIKEVYMNTGLTSSFLNITKGIPQGLVLWPTLFTVHIHDVGQNIYASLYVYADDAILHC